jgi:AAA domain
MKIKIYGKRKERNMENSDYIPSKIFICGDNNVGKTSLLYTLPAESTLFVSIEAGESSVKDWVKDNEERIMRPLTWDRCVKLCSAFCRHDATVSSGDYSRSHHVECLEELYGKYGKERVDGIKNVFIDSMTEASRLALRHFKSIPENKTNGYKLYGDLGSEMVKWMSHWQKNSKVNVFFLCLLNKGTIKYSKGNTEYEELKYSLQLEGEKASKELVGIFDQILTMAPLLSKRGEPLKNDKGQTYRGLYTDKYNDFGYPCRDRTGALKPIDAPHLGRILEKINTLKQEESLIHDLPAGF